MTSASKKRINRLVALMLTVLMFAFAIPAVAAEDDDWITVRVACDVNNSLYLNEDGEPEGYCAKYITQLAQINHWNLEYVPASWNDSVQNLLDGKIDLLFPTQKTDDRVATMGFSTAIGGYQPIGLYAGADSDLCFDDYAGFEGKRVALSAGTSNEAVMQEYAAQNNFTYVPVYMNTTPEKLEALSSGTVDMIVFSTLNDVPDGKVVAMLDYLPFYYCTRIDDTKLLNALNYGMNQMIIRHPDTVQDVFSAFISRTASFAYTKEEKNAIAANGSVVVGIYEDMPPLFDKAADGTYEGIYVDLIERLKSISGLDIQIQPLPRDGVLLQNLNNGAVDFVMGCSYELQQYPDGAYVQTEGIMDYYIVGVTRNNFLLSANTSLTFALTADKRYMQDALTLQYPGCDFLYCATTKDCLNAVQSHRADITMVNSWEYNYQSKNQRFENLIEWENTRTLTSTVFMSAQNSDALLRTVLDKSIEQVSNPEKEATITANLNRAYSSYSPADKLYEMRYTLFIFACVLAVVAACVAVYVVMRRRAMRALEGKNRQLENANAAKDRFLSRMSHELRTPLNAINGYATVMEQDLDAHTADKGKTREYIESILRAAKYQLAIIGDLLDIQKIDSDKIALTPTAVNTQECMNGIVEMICPEANEKGVHFTYQALTKTEDAYEIDAVRFQQVLLNLLHNALKFTPKGGEVSLTAEVAGHDEAADTLKFTVTDNGIGMSEDFQKNYLFHRFAQEYQGNTSPYEGCGIGLATSRELIHRMGGEITCKSEQGVGSVFTVVLTAKRCEKKQETPKKSDVPFDLSGIHVLLCEDNKMNQDIERRLLQRMKCTVDIADDGQIGVDKYLQSAEGTYDAVLMDIRMPNMDGLEAARAIRAAKRADAKSIVILAVSANSFEEDVQKSLAAGMNEHLAKPVAAAMLYEKIIQYCRPNKT